MHADEIICCDWGLYVAAAESNLQFLWGEKGTCVFLRPSLFIHDHKSLLPFHKRSIYFVHKHQNQVFHMTMYLRAIGYDMKIAICGEKLFIVASNTTDLFCCRSSEME